MNTNDEINYLRELARFPNENPNPVFRANNNCEVTYYNAAAKTKLNINNAQAEIHKLIEDFVRKDQNKVMAEKTILTNQIYYQVTCQKLNESSDCLFYAKDVTELRVAIKEKMRAFNRLETLIENLGNSVIIEDENRRIVLINQQFCDVLSLPIKAKDLIGADCSMLIKIIKDKFKNPNIFEKRVNYLLKSKDIIRSEKIETKNGKVFERDYIPVNDKETGIAIGNMWKYRDVTEQQKLLNALKKSEEKYRGIINNMNLGLIEVDLFENIVYCNKAFAKILQYEPEEIIGKNARKLFIFDSLEENILDEKLNSRSMGKSDLYEIRLKNKYNHTLWMMISGAPIYNEFGRIIGSIGIHLDITDRKKMEMELENARKNALELLRAKEKFLALMSHEIRTPLNGIIGISQILESNLSYSKQNKYIKALTSSSNTLLSLVNDVLDFSKIEAGKFQIDYKEIDLSEIIKNIKQNFILKTQEKGILLKVDYENNIPKYIIGDSLRINQVLSNLISNAIKFTSKGYINISIKLLQKEGNMCKIRFIVKDSGIGMTSTTALSVFEQYTQGDATIASKFGGTGLGLNISLKLVELMGGNIYVSSEKEIGTTFCFNLTFQALDKKDLAPNKNKEIKKSLKKLNILIVDDNEINLLVTETMLKNAGAQIVLAKTGIEALNKVKEYKFDIIMMDIQMPEMDGLEATNIIRNTFKLNIPIIGLTANTNHEIISQLKDKGFNEVISKPFKESDLINCIFTYAYKNPNSYISTNEGNNVLLANQEFSLDGINEIAKGNSQFIKKLLSMAVTQLEEQCTDLRAALSISNQKIAAGIIHKIKPTLAHFKANNLAEAASFLQIETNITKETGDAFLKKLEEFTSLLKTEEIKFNPPS